MFHKYMMTVTFIPFIICLILIVLSFSYKDIRIIIDSYFYKRKKIKTVNLKAIEMLKSDDLQEILNFTISNESFISNANFMNLVERTTKLAAELVDPSNKGNK